MRDLAGGKEGGRREEMYRAGVDDGLRTSEECPDGV